MAVSDTVALARTCLTSRRTQHCPSPCPVYRPDIAAFHVVHRSSNALCLKALLLFYHFHEVGAPCVLVGPVVMQACIGVRTPSGATVLWCSGALVVDWMRLDFWSFAPFHVW